MVPLVTWFANPLPNKDHPSYEAKAGPSNPDSHQNTGVQVHTDTYRESPIEPRLLMELEMVVQAFPPSPWEVGGG